MNKYSQKHILFVSTIPPSSGCGPPVINYRHLKRLKNWKVSVIINKGGVQKAHDLPVSWQVVPISQQYLLSARSRGKLLQQLHQQLKKPSAIFNYFGANSILAYHLSATWNVPLSIMIHDPLEICTKSWVERYCMGHGWTDTILNHASRIWSFSHELADSYAMHNMEKVKILRLIPEGNIDGFAKWRDNFQKHPVVAFGGSFRLHEVEYFTIIARALQKINGTLLLITTKNYIVKMLMRDFPNVEFRKPDDNVGVINLFKKRASCVLVPLCFDLDRHSWRRFGFPAKLTEFTHLGLPVIILSPDGTPLSNWAKEHKWRGYLNTLNSKRILALLKEITNKESWMKMAEQSKSVALNEFNPDNIQAQFESELVIQK